MTAAVVSAAAAVGSLINEIVKANQGSGMDREAFVKSILEKLIFEISRQQLGLNALVFNLGQPYEKELKGVVHYWPVQYDGTSYGIWLFRSRTFKNLGEGSYKNWGMYGHFESSGGRVKGGRMGRHVQFFSRTDTCLG